MKEMKILQIVMFANKEFYKALFTSTAASSENHFSVVVIIAACTLCAQTAAAIRSGCHSFTLYKSMADATAVHMWASEPPPKKKKLLWGDWLGLSAHLSSYVRAEPLTNLHFCRVLAAANQPVCMQPLIRIFQYLSVQSLRGFFITAS